MLGTEIKISKPEKGRWGAVIMKSESDDEWGWLSWTQKDSWVIRSIMWDK